MLSRDSAMRLGTLRADLTHPDESSLLRNVTRCVVSQLLGPIACDLTVHRLSGCYSTDRRFRCFDQINP